MVFSFCKQAVVFMALAFFLLIAQLSFSAPICLDTNAPIDAATGSIAAPAQVVADTNTEYVRVNFILGPWTSPSDSTLHGSQNKTWFQTYDSIIDAFVLRGVKVYALVGAEAVHSSSSNLNSDQYVNDYVSNFTQIVEHFKDRVFIYESFNEPNDWAGGTSAQVKPLWFAKMLEKIYRAVKIDNGHLTDPTWQVKLISGPLFSHDMDTCASYFTDVYENGITSLGWTDVKNITGSYPLDGIGYHIYVAQGSSDPATITQKMNENLDAIFNAYISYEGSGSTKKIYVSECGWRVDYVGGEDNQQTNLETSLGLLLADRRIGLATWFCLKDFGENGYGLFRTSGLSENDKKPSWYSFYNIATANRIPYAAVFTYNNLPKEMAAGQKKAVKITVKNTGSQAWPGAGVNNLIRLRAANSSASTGYLNSFTWSDFANGGFFNSNVDAEAYLGASVATGWESDFNFSITAPGSSGAFPFSAKMYDSLASDFFGDSLGGYILVQKDNENAIRNPGFEKGDLSSWTQFGETDGAISGGWFAGVSAQEGSYFLGSAANYGQKNGGVFQQINAYSESTYGARVYIRTYSEGAGQSSCRLGLDPTGGINPASESIVWTSWAANQGSWTPLYLFVNPLSSKITLFLEGKQESSVWNVTCFDNCLVVPSPAPIESRLLLFH